MNLSGGHALVAQQNPVTLTKENNSGKAGSSHECLGHSFKGISVGTLAKGVSEGVAGVAVAAMTGNIALGAGLAVKGGKDIFSALQGHHFHERSASPTEAKPNLNNSEAAASPECKAPEVIKEEASDSSGGDESALDEAHRDETQGIGEEGAGGMGTSM